MRARRLPCLTHTKTMPEEPVDAATLSPWLLMSIDDATAAAERSAPSEPSSA